MKSYDTATNTHRQHRVKKTKPTSPLGQGSRFKMIAERAAANGARNPNAVAAAAGIKKYGVKKMEQLAHAGRK